MLTPLPTGTQLGQNIPEPSPFTKSKTRQDLITALDTFNQKPWKIALLDVIQDKAYEMMSKHFHKGRKYRYLSDLIRLAEQRKSEIDQRLDRLSNQMQFGTPNLGFSPGKGLKGVFALEMQKHKGPRIRGSDFQVQLFMALQMMEFGMDDPILRDVFEDPQSVKDSLSDGNFMRLSRQDLYALKKFYKNQQQHQNFRFQPSEYLPYFSQDQRDILRLTFAGNEEHGAGVGVYQRGAAYDTRGFGGGDPQREEMALYVCSLDGSFFAMDGFRTTGEEVFRLLQLDHEDLLNHSSFMSGGSVYSAGWLRAVNGELTDINNDSGHYKPSARDLSLAITIIGSNNDLSRLRAAARISGTHFFYFPAAELYAGPGEARKSNWQDIQEKVVLSSQEYRTVYKMNGGTGPIAMGDLIQQYRQRTVGEMVRTESEDQDDPFIRLRKMVGPDPQMWEVEQTLYGLIFPFDYK